MNARYKATGARSTGLLLTLALMGISLSIGLAAAPAGLTTHLLSDHEATEGGMQVLPNLAVTAGGTAAYVLWTEDSGSAEGYALFSRRLPVGSTSEIPDHHFQFHHPSTLQGESAADGRACFIWSEDTASPEGTTLYFWDSAGEAVGELSANDLTEGDVQSDRMQLMVSSGGANVLWDEQTGSYTELFYWNEVQGTTRQLSDSDLPAGSIGLIAPMVEGGGSIHVAWSEWAGPGGYSNVYYWDSATETVRNLSPAGDVGVPVDLEITVDTAGTAHLLWGEEVSPPDSTCPLHWDSDSGVVQNLASAHGGCVAAEMNLVPDNAGGVHAAWLGDYDGTNQPSIFYWSTAIPTTTVVVTDVTGSPLLSATPAGTAHVAWTHEADAGTEGSDLFHWDSNAAMVTNISDVGLTSGSVASPRMAATSDGRVYIVWLEVVDDVEQADVFLFSSTGQTTVRLSDPAVVSGSASPALLQVASGGTAHVLWEEDSEATTGRALFYWNSADGVLTELGSTVTSGGGQPRLLLDPEGHAHVAWISESGVGEGENVWYWTAAAGAQPLSDLGGTEGDIAYSSLNAVIDDYGGVYVVWAEQSGTAEGDDLYGAWIRPEFPEKVFLPLVLGQ